MQEKDKNNKDKVFNNRVLTLEKYFEIFEDKDDVEVYLYDLIAYALSKDNNNNINYKYIKFFNTLIKSLDDDDTLNLKGSDLKDIYQFILNNDMPNSLHKILESLYQCNEDRIVNNYKINYKEYENLFDYNILKENSNILDERIKHYINSISSLNDKYCKNTYEFFFVDDSLVCNNTIYNNTVTYFGDEAEKIFNKVKSNLYNDIYINSLDIKGKKIPIINLSNTDELIKFRNCFKNKDYIINNFYNSSLQIEKALRNYLIDNNKPKRKHNIKNIVAGYGVAASIIAAGIAAGSHSNNNYNNSQSTTISSTHNPLDEDSYINNDNQDYDETLHFDYSNSDKYLEVRDKYSSLCEEIGEKYGVSPELLVAIITQESGGKDENIMHIEFDYCSDEVISVDNFITGKKDKFVLTDNKDKYDSSVNIIDSKMLNDPYYNVLMGCAILQKTARDFDYNIPMVIQGYNYGLGNMYKVLNVASKNLGVSIDSLIDDKENYDWLYYRNLDVGDNKYFEHVCRYLDSDLENIYINNFEGNHKLNIIKGHSK